MATAIEKILDSYETVANGLKKRVEALIDFDDERNHIGINDLFLIDAKIAVLLSDMGFLPLSLGQLAIFHQTISSIEDDIDTITTALEGYYAEDLFSVTYMVS